ncbi:hypothetical protein KAJ27_15770 [bacterium]|nr:hypothetical protein [bacterium]
MKKYINTILIVSTGIFIISLFGLVGTQFFLSTSEDKISKHATVSKNSEILKFINNTQDIKKLRKIALSSFKEHVDFGKYICSSMDKLGSLSMVFLFGATAILYYGFRLRKEILNLKE